ncbi:MAG: hypothetical protein MZV64_13065 [Ignavibacteriales bacterium]|nr:hypothetical protein [Ignavibacteriales bacterium]
MQGLLFRPRGRPEIRLSAQSPDGPGHGPLPLLHPHRARRGDRGLHPAARSTS